MSEEPLNILAVIGSLNRNSVTRVVVLDLVEQLEKAGCRVDVLDFLKEPLELYNPDTAYTGPTFAELKARVDRADALVLATPDYHGSISSALKSFLDHFWREFAGKLFATIVASHEKGLTVTDQLRTVARQCNAWTLPYGVSFMEADVQEGKVVTERVRLWLQILARDTHVYGKLLAQQRRADLEGDDFCFLARLRKGR
jgi:NAD(P)H-dependent FMN reductase